MTTHPATYCACDRCDEAQYIQATTNPPAHTRPSIPDGWIQIKIGFDLSDPPSHLCLQCADQFREWMEHGRSADA